MTDPPPVASVSTSRAGFELLGASFVVLFQELALIRWLPGQVRALAYFPNLIIIAAFLGLGVGALRARRAPFFWLWPVSLLLLGGAAWMMSGVAFTAEGQSEWLWLLYSDLPTDAPVVSSVHLPIVVLFILSAASFVPLGQIVGARLNTFREQSTPLWGYSLDLAGSLLGVAAFTVFSFMGTGPAVWFGVVAGAGVLVVRRRTGERVLYVSTMLLVLAVVLLAEKADRYSPYYALSTAGIQGTSDVRVRANGSLHQVAFDVSGEREDVGWLRSRARAGYQVPYDMLGRAPGRVLVLGAGTGNDVAVALMNGATEVHAVEIDPVIIEMGRELHPNDPYADPRVTVVATDARSFLNDTDETYDLIVFGTLDSMTRLAALSNVRLDNFVYTREGLAAAARQLAPGGGMILYFSVAEEFIWDHLVVMMQDVFGEIPVVRRNDWQLFNNVFMNGPGFDHLDRPETPASLLALTDGINMPSDDWPYLYLSHAHVGGFYLGLMVTFFGVAVLALLLASPDLRKDIARGRGVDWEMFLFGLAFLLLETRYVTEMNLVWGATWLTSSVVFGAILATILLATVVTELRPMPWNWAALGLAVTLAVTWLLPSEALLTQAMAPRLLLSILFVGAPVFFAGILFAIRFRTRTATDAAFGWNLLGAVAGGLTEFFSMAIGLKALVLVAIAAYGGVFLLAGRSGREAAEAGS